MKIVYIDHYDSFANTIKGYFINAGAEVIMLKSDCSIETIEKENPKLIVLGPGPNGPKDAGNYLKVIEHFHSKVPLFGICLGFQALIEYFGEEVKQLKEIVHGAASPVEHDGKGIFKGIPANANFARYHSLGTTIAPDCFEVSAKTGNIIMAVRHKELPIRGVQFHPESILSLHDKVGEKIIKNVLLMIPK